MGQQGNVWTNDLLPVQAGGMVMCPQCGNPITGPFSATMPDNKIVRKWACTACRYIWKIEGGNFKNAFEANPVSFG